MLNGWGAAAVVLLFIAVLLLVAGLQHHLTSLAPGPVDMPHLATKDNSDIAFSPFENRIGQSCSSNEHVFHRSCKCSSQA